MVTLFSFSSLLFSFSFSFSSLLFSSLLFSLLFCHLISSDLRSPPFSLPTPLPSLRSLQQKLTLDSTLANIITEDLHHAKLTFTEAADTKEHQNGRNFRRQYQYTEWFIDIIHRTPASNLTEGVFKPMCKAHEKQVLALPHVYGLISQLLLCRDFQPEEDLW